MKLISHLFLMLITMVLVTSTASGAYQRNDMKNKFPQQWLLEKNQVVNPIAATTNTILNANAGPTSAAPVTVTTFASQPDFARNIVVTPGGTTADVAAGNLVITGKNIFGRTITETFVISNAQSAASTGIHAFASITSVLIPAEQGTFAATWSIGVGARFGLRGCLDGAGWYLKGLNGGADLTSSTVTANAQFISQNLVTPNPAADGTKTFDFLFFPNYKCY